MIWLSVNGKQKAHTISYENVISLIQNQNQLAKWIGYSLGHTQKSCIVRDVKNLHFDM